MPCKTPRLSEADAVLLPGGSRLAAHRGCFVRDLGVTECPASMAGSGKDWNSTGLGAEFKLVPWFLRALHSESLSHQPEMVSP